jgi:hypothetical protein
MPSPSSTSIAPQASPKPLYRPDEEEELLICEELEARMAPGGIVSKPPRRTAGWGC